MARPRSRADRGSYPLDTAQSTPEARTRVKLPPDPYRDDEPRPGRARRPLILLSALVALVAAVTIVNRSTHHSSTGAPAAGQQAASGSAASGPAASSTGPVTTPAVGNGLPTNTADKVPVGYPHTSAGAESAAANYVVAYTSSSMVRSDARHRLIAAIADPAIASSLQSQLNSTYQQANSSYGLSAGGTPPAGQTFVQRSAPVGVTLVNQSGNGATVSI